MNITIYSSKIPCLRQNARSVYCWYLLYPCGAWWSHCDNIQQSQGWVQPLLITGCLSWRHSRARGSPHLWQQGFNILLLFVRWCYKEALLFQSVKPTVRVPAQKINRWVKRNRHVIWQRIALGSLLVFSYRPFARLGFAEKLSSSKQPLLYLAKKRVVCWRQLGRTGAHVSQQPCRCDASGHGSA